MTEVALASRELKLLAAASRIKEAQHHKDISKPFLASTCN